MLDNEQLKKVEKNVDMPRPKCKALPMFKTVAQAEAVCGSLSKPSKMPCHGYSIPASRCKIGQKMRNVAGSICSKCYALKGRYVFPAVQAALELRFQSLSNPLWVEAISFLIGKQEKSGFFRWHDSGDIQDTKHLHKIVQVAENLPHIQFWLPTREYNIVADYLKTLGGFPANLTVRLSSLYFDGDVTDRQNPFGLPTSGASKAGFNCPSSKQGNKCLDCRACWSKSVANITYKQH